MIDSPAVLRQLAIRVMATTRIFSLVLRSICLGGLFAFTAIAVAAETASLPPVAPTPNRLGAEKSPYLRQHALNPVDWYPWGTEAFEKARRENKAIFLSVGYSTCHWCHVMAQESFSDPETARLLNANFVCIKVDREERPDIDRVYMTFVQASMGGGGWPMSVWLTPDLKPFFGGTYFPPESRGGLPGFKTVITRVASLWTERREQVLEQSDRMLQALKAEAPSANATEAVPIAKLRQKGFEAAVASFDADHGGFEKAPKFPLPVMLEFLLDLQATTKDVSQREKAQGMVIKTLREIVAGGIHDQLGGGFHRYAVDEKWHVPHFEKMLYDQAQLASVCLTAWQVSGDETLKDAAIDTLKYVSDRMTDPDGGFRTAEDADSAIASGANGISGTGVSVVSDQGRDAHATPDAHVTSSEHHEGAYYVWKATEIEGALGPEKAAVFEFVFGVQRDGNVATYPQGEFRGENILFRAHTAAEAAGKFRRAEEEIRAMLDASTRELVSLRERRPHPPRDDKIVTAWNGLTISAFARAAQVLGDPTYSATAERAAAFLQDKAFDPATRRLSHRYFEGVRDNRGFAEDYSFLIQGLLDLYETTFATRWLEWASELQEKQLELFWDPAAGGFFANAADDPSVMLRLKEDNEGAEPSPSSIAVRNLVRLSEMLHREEWRELAQRTVAAFSAQMQRTPTGMAQMLASAGWLEGTPKQVLVVGASNSEKTARLVGEVWQRFIPRRVLVRVDERSRPYLEKRVPFVAGVPDETGDNATVYVCENFVCQLPTQDPAVLVKLLQP